MMTMKVLRDNLEAAEKTGDAEAVKKAKAELAFYTYTENRDELSERYFPGLKEHYADGNMGMISLMSDLQGFIGFNLGETKETQYWNRVLNDLKGVLIREDQAREDLKEGRGKMESFGD